MSKHVVHNEFLPGPEDAVKCYTLKAVRNEGFLHRTLLPYASSLTDILQAVHICRTVRLDAQREGPAQYVPRRIQARSPPTRDPSAMNSIFDDVPFTASGITYRKPTTTNLLHLERLSTTVETGDRLARWIQGINESTSPAPYEPGLLLSSTVDEINLESLEASDKLIYSPTPEQTQEEDSSALLPDATLISFGKTTENDIPTWPPPGLNETIRPKNKSPLLLSATPSPSRDGDSTQERRIPHQTHRNAALPRRSPPAIELAGKQFSQLPDKHSRQIAEGKSRTLRPPDKAKAKEGTKIFKTVTHQQLSKGKTPKMDTISAVQRNLPLPDLVPRSGNCKTHPRDCRTQTDALQATLR